MRAGLQIGEQFEYSLVVSEADSASLNEGPVHPLYGTAAMITHMEWAARQHILPYLEPDEEGVGHHVDVTHLAPTAIGDTVRIRSTVTAIEPRRVTSHVEAWNHNQKIGEGHLTQALVRTEILYQAAQKSTATSKVAVSSGAMSESAQALAASQAIPSESGLSVEAIAELAGEGEAFGAEAISNLELLALPPAVLVSTEGQSRFTLELLRWETGFLPCTRYDEWLVCRIVLEAPDATGHYEGACLLRYEIEEWLAGVTAWHQGNRPELSTDFLEPVLKLHLSSPQDQPAVRITLTPPEGSTTQILLPTRDDLLAQFIDQLTAQLDGFPSLM